MNLFAIGRRLLLEVSLFVCSKYSIFQTVKDLITLVKGNIIL